MSSGWLPRTFVYEPPSVEIAWLGLYIKPFLIGPPVLQTDTQTDTQKGGKHVGGKIPNVTV